MRLQTATFCVQSLSPPLHRRPPRPSRILEITTGCTLVVGVPAVWKRVKSKTMEEKGERMEEGDREEGEKEVQDTKSNVQFADFVKVATGVCKELLLECESEQIAQNLVTHFNRAADEMAQAHQTSKCLLRILLEKWKRRKPEGTILSLDERMQFVR